MTLLYDPAALLYASVRPPAVRGPCQPSNEVAHCGLLVFPVVKRLDTRRLVLGCVMTGLEHDSRARGDGLWRGACIMTTGDSWLNGTVGLTVLSVDHAQEGMAVVSAAAASVEGLAVRLTDAPQVRGAMVLSTCNRVAVVMETDLSDEQLRALVAELDAPTLAADGKLLRDDEAVWRLFRVASGLESMVTGEREIAGQLKRALSEARKESTVSYLIGHVVEEALKTSRKVATHTGLASQGRTVVAVGLDLVSRTTPLEGARVVVLGTGSYAGASCAQLVNRGVSQIAVASARGRAEDFAESHEVAAIAPDDLIDELATADLVVACRGRKTAALDRATATQVMAQRDGRPLPVLDLAVGGDVELPAPEGIEVINLVDISAAVPDSTEKDRRAAEKIVADGVHDLALDLERRRMAPAVVALRDVLTDLVEAEVAKLPAEGEVSVEDATRSLRRLAASIAHIPSARARIASEQGLGDRWLNSLTDVLGIDVDLPAPIIDLSDTGSQDDLKCPVTGLTVRDLAPKS